MTVAKAIVIGNVGGDPEIREFTKKNGDTGKVANFSIATTDGFGDNQKTHWHKIVTFDSRLIENVISKYVKKGSKLYAEGNLTYGSYMKEGATVNKTEIVIGFSGQIQLLDSKKSNGVEFNESSAKADAAVHIVQDAEDEITI
ncbi:MAG TPA: single-stranded DNA-binding protein [Alphaproteobacteria bacterium]|nr:single-stranded DNA-binding protein [Alphaproteobacteria bacterium]|tara:strand:- start:626 stop:1054 length:429 start_codon:yes stop_codon:yes gene_type:complete